jgi:predicted O-methyltransferase YrrM
MGSAIVMLSTCLALAAETPAAEPVQPVEHVESRDVVGLLGQMVQSPSGKDIGRIIDLLVDANGVPRAAVIDVGGFLGMGSRKVAIEWPAIHFASSDKGVVVTLDMPSDRIKAAPEYVAGHKVAIVGPES